MSMRNAELFIPLGDVDDVQSIPHGAEVTVGMERLRVEFIDQRIVRLKLSQGGVFDEAPTFAVAYDRLGEVDCALAVTESDIVVSTPALRVQIERHPFSFHVFDREGHALVESVAEWGYRHLNDAWLVRRHAEPADGFYGLGEKTGPVDHRGKTLAMWNTDILAPDTEGQPRSSTSDDPYLNPTSTVFDPYYMSIPILYHRRGKEGWVSGSFFDNGYRMHLDLSRTDFYEVGADNGQLTEYVFADTTVPEILRQYARLTGRMPAPPIWALGYHQCRWYDYTEEQWLQLAAGYRRKDIPCDTLWLDIGYMDEYRVFTWNRERHPDVQGSLSRLS